MHETFKTEEKPSWKKRKKNFKLDNKLKKRKKGKKRKKVGNSKPMQNKMKNRI